jgi:hypothetical protein
MSEEIIATAQELAEATRQALFDTRPKEEKMSTWVAWFKKRGPQLFRDAVSKGSWNLYLQLPYAPIPAKTPGKIMYYMVTIDDKQKKLEDWLAEQLPGCKIEFVDIEDEEENGKSEMLLEISWPPKKKKKSGFVADETHIVTAIE